MSHRVSCAQLHRLITVRCTSPRPLSLLCHSSSGSSLPTDGSTLGSLMARTRSPALSPRTRRGSQIRLKGRPTTPSTVSQESCARMSPDLTTLQGGLSLPIQLWLAEVCRPEKDARRGTSEEVALLRSTGSRTIDSSPTWCGLRSTGVSHKHIASAVTLLGRQC